MRRFRMLFALMILPAVGGCASGACNCSSVAEGPAEARSAAFRRAPVTAPPVAAGSGGAIASASTRLQETASLLASWRALDAHALFAAPADAVATTPPRATFRCPATAFCLACLAPGGGQLYSGETLKGAALLGVAAAGLIGGVALSDDGGGCYEPGLTGCTPDGAGRAPLLIGGGIAAASWIYGLVDSKASAARMNARNGMEVGGAALEPQPWLGLRSGSPSAGLRFRVTW